MGDYYGLTSTITAATTTTTTTTTAATITFKLSFMYGDS